VTDWAISRVTGAVAVLAGVLLAAGAWVQSRQPVGCVGDACDTQPMRDSPTSVSVLVAIGGVALIASALGLALLMQRRGRLGGLGAWGAALSVVGIGLFAAGAVIQAALADGNLSAMPAFVGSGVALLSIGLLLLAVAVLRSRTLPVWWFVLMAVTVVLIPFGNEQTSAILLDIPVALTWALGGVLLLAPGRATARPATA
jgi:hypothetical protein